MGRWKTPLLAVAAVLVGSGAAAQDHIAVITHPDWVRLPSGKDLEGVWPLAAARKGVSGKARIDCSVTAEGLLADCKVVSETPADSGFGGAALLLAPRFLMKPQTVDGQPVAGARVTVPFNFDGPVSIPEPNHLGSRIEDDRDPGLRLIANPVWTSAPTAGDVAAAFPAKATPETIAGHVVLQCALKADGALGTCDVSSELPKGQGFGSAARTLARKFSIAMTTLNAADLPRTRINLPIHFLRPGPPGAPRMLADVEWIRTLSPDKIQEVFPAKAANAGLSTGRAVLECAVAPNGFMTQCATVDEQPAGMDFGPAAIRVAQAMGINPWTPEGLPAEGGHVKFAIRLNRQDQPAPTSPPAAAKP